MIYRLLAPDVFSRQHQRKESQRPGTCGKDLGLAAILSPIKMEDVPCLVGALEHFLGIIPSGKR
jgi:hypothetical protein